MLPSLPQLPPDEVRKLTSATYLELHKHAHEVARIRAKLSGEAINAGLNALMLLNGGALIALGTLIGRDSQSAVAQVLVRGAWLHWIVGLFCLGLALAVFAYAGAWLAQDQLKVGREEMAMNYARFALGIESDQAAAVAVTKRGDRWSIAAGISAGGSLLGFMIGAALLVECAADAHRLAAVASSGSAAQAAVLGLSLK